MARYISFFVLSVVKVFSHLFFKLEDRWLNGRDNFDWKNATFTRPKRYSRESSEALDDDRLSLASSDTSSSHRLNDVGDVQNLARLQEESKISKAFFQCANFIL